MKKWIFILLCLIGLASKAHAFSNPGLIYDVALTSATQLPISVSTVTATTMDAIQLSGRVSISIQNQDGSANLWCGFNSNVAVSGALRGHKIAAGNSWSLSIVGAYYTPQTYSSTPAHVYCISDGTGSTNASVEQMY